MCYQNAIGSIGRKSLQIRESKEELGQGKKKGLRRGQKVRKENEGGGILKGDWRVEEEGNLGTGTGSRKSGIRKGDLLGTSGDWEFTKPKGNQGR